MPPDTAHEPPTFRNEPLHQILPHLRAQLAATGEATILVPDPDHGVGLYPGETTHVGTHRPYQVWVDVADRLDCHLLTPERTGDHVRLRFLPASGGRALPRERGADRYGPGSEFERIDKLEDPVFLEDAMSALRLAELRPGARILGVGVHGGRELDLLGLTYPGVPFDVVGIDVNDAALHAARTRHPTFTFSNIDVNDLPRPDLGRFELILALSVLQSPGIDRDRVFRTLLRAHLAPGGTIIIGLPNCRYERGRVSYGARLLNYRAPELSLLLRDAAQYRRHLQKHDFRVHVTGKYDVLITGVHLDSARRERNADPA